MFSTQIYDFSLEPQSKTKKNTKDVELLEKKLYFCRLKNKKRLQGCLQTTHV